MCGGWGVGWGVLTQNEMIQPVSSTNKPSPSPKMSRCKKGAFNLSCYGQLSQSISHRFFFSFAHSIHTGMKNDTLEHLLHLTSLISFELPDLNPRKRCCSTKGLGFKERRIEGALLCKTNKGTNKADRCMTSKMIQGSGRYQMITV